MPTPNDEITIHVRCPRAKVRLLDEAARFHGRPRSAELRAAIDIHTALTTYHYLLTPEGEAEVAAKGQDIEEARAKVAADLASLKDAIYTRPPAPAPQAAKAWLN